jgi:hypothetical protein
MKNDTFTSRVLKVRDQLNRKKNQYATGQNSQLDQKLLDSKLVTIEDIGGKNEKVNSFDNFNNVANQ